MKSVVKRAKTIEAAIEACLTELNADLDDCKVTIIEQPKSGIFGIIGQKDAVIKLELKEDKDEVSDFVERVLDLDKKTNVEPQKEVKKEIKKEVKKDIKTKEVKKDKEYIKAKEDIKVEVKETKDKKDEIKSSINEEKTMDKSSVNMNEPIKHKYVSKNKKKTSKKNVKKAVQVKEDKKAVKEVKKQEIEVIEVSNEEKEEITSFLKEFVSEIMSSMHIPGDINVEIQGNEIYIDLDSMEEDDVGIAIGKKAETLNSIQYITAIALNKKVDKYFRLFLNISGYRERRKDQIEENAKKKAEQVLRNRKPQALKAMNSYERKLVHFALQDMKNIETVSEGREPYRKVVIKYKK